VPRDGSAHERGVLATGFDLEACAEILRAAGAAEIALSRFAGGYVCERIYYHALFRARELGLPALFVHVPPATAVPVERQVQVLAPLVQALARGEGSGAVGAKERAARAPRR
jgi:pyrrolidone-carboxylate peptidase